MSEAGSGDGEPAEGASMEMPREAVGEGIIPPGYAPVKAAKGSCRRCRLKRLSHRPEPCPAGTGPYGGATIFSLAFRSASICFSKAASDPSMCDTARAAV